MALQQVNGTIHSLVKTEQEWLSTTTIIPKNQWVYVQVDKDDGTKEFYGKLGDGVNSFTALPKAMLSPSDVEQLAQGVIDSKADQSALDETNQKVADLETKVDTNTSDIESVKNSVSTLNSELQLVSASAVKTASSELQTINSDIALGQGKKLYGVDSANTNQELISIGLTESEEATETVKFGNTAVNTTISSLDRPTIQLSDSTERMAYLSDINSSLTTDLEQEIADRKAADAELDGKITELSNNVYTKTDADAKFAIKSEIPTELPNPEALTIKYNGVQAFSYDGSSAETGNFIVNAETVPMSDSDTTTISTVLGTKANTADVYKKAETYSQAEVNSKLSDKLDTSVASSTYATQTSLTSHTSDTENPHGVTKAQVGLGNVDNTSDLNKPVSTATQTALDLKANSADVYKKVETYSQAEVDSKLATKLDTSVATSTYATKEELNAKVSSVYKYKGSVANEAALPSSDNETGDVYNVEDTGMNYAWDGEKWDKLGGEIDLSLYLSKEEASSTYATKSEIPTKLPNPNALTVKYNGTQAFVYDGSSAETSNLIVNAETVPMSDSDTTTIAVALSKKADTSSLGTMASENADDYSTTEEANSLYAPASLSETVSTLSSKVDTKANSADVYKKAETYSQAEVNSKLAVKLDAATASTTYATITTVTGIEGKIPEAASSDNKLVDKQSMTTALAGKADTSSLGTMASKDADDYSTTEEANALYAPIALSDTVSTLSSTVNTKANSADVYTKTDADAKFALLSSVNTINTYMPEDVSNTNKLVDTNTMTTALAGKADTSSLGTMASENVDDYSTTEETNALYAPIALSETVSTLSSTVNTKANSADVYKKTETYSKTEVDSKLGAKLDTSVASSTYATQATVTGIEEKIPEAASSSNQLVDNQSMTTALSLKANTADVYTKGEVDQKVTSVYKYKGSVANEAALPSSNNQVGDVYNVEDTGMNYAWDGTKWDSLGTNIDLSSYLKKDEASSLYAPIALSETVSTLSSTVNTKANSADVYKKTETYSQSEVDSKLSAKLDTSVASSTYATQATVTGIEGKIPETASSDNKLVDNQAMTTALAKKADTSSLGTMANENTDDYSTTEEANALYAPIALSETVSTLSSTVNTKANSADVYKKTETYSQSEVDSKLTAKLDTSVASSTYATQASVTGIEEKIPETASSDNKLVDNQSMTTALAGKADTSSLGTMASEDADDYSTKAVADTLYAPISLSNTVASLSSTVESKANSADVYKKTDADAKFALLSTVNTINTYMPEDVSDSNKLVDTTTMNGLLSAKANASDVYNKSEVDGKLGAKLDTSTATSTYATIVTVNTKADADNVYDKATVDEKLNAKLDTTTASTTYATQTTVNGHTSNTDNPHSVTKAQVGLGNVDNTSDLDKPVSTATQTALNLKANSADVYTKSQVDTELAKKLDTSVATSTYATKEELNAKVSSVYRVKGSVANEGALPSSDNQVGDVYNVESDGSNYVWDGEKWDKLGGTVDLSDYYTKSEVNSELSKKLDTTTAESTYLTQSNASSTYATISALNGKADASTVSTIQSTIAGYGTMATKNADDYSTKSVADTLYAPIALSETVSTLSSTVSNKANASDVYTKTVADSTFATKTELSTKADSSSIGNATITVKKNGSQVGTFTTNQTSPSEINITVPTQTSDLTNDSSFVVGDTTVTAIKLYASEEEARQASLTNPTWMCLYPN